MGCLSFASRAVVLVVEERGRLSRRHLRVGKVRSVWSRRRCCCVGCSGRERSRRVKCCRLREDELRLVMRHVRHMSCLGRREGRLRKVGAHCGPRHGCVRLYQPERPGIVHFQFFNFKSERV